MIGTDDLKKTEMITLTSVDKMKLEDISNQINNGIEKLKSNTETNSIRRHFLAKILPTL